MGFDIRDLHNIPHAWLINEHAKVSAKKILSVFIIIIFFFRRILKFGSMSRQLSFIRRICCLIFFFVLKTHFSQCFDIIFFLISLFLASSTSHLHYAHFYSPYISPTLINPLKSPSECNEPCFFFFASFIINGEL